MQRYEEKVDRSAGPDACHPWLAYREEKAGYGIFWFEGRMRPAHRVGWELLNGPIPDGMYLCHACDNPCCQNPKHWFLGTPTDNAQDRADKGRSAVGARSGRSRLTTAQVVEMRRLRSEGALVKDIAARFSIDNGYASRLLRGINWTHLEAAS